MAGAKTHHTERVVAMPEGWYRPIVRPAPAFQPAGPAMATLPILPAGSVGSYRNAVPNRPPTLSVYVPPAMARSGPVANATAVGTSRFVVVPSSSCALPCKPQQYAAPLVVTPPVYRNPALTAANERPPATGVGTSSGTSPPLPQQYATLLVVTPQVWLAPALIAANERPPATGVGTSWPMFVPSPSWPAELSPQQDAARVV